VIEPRKELFSSVSVQVFRGTIIEVGIKLMNDWACGGIGMAGKNRRRFRLEGISKATCPCLPSQLVNQIATKNIASYSTVAVVEQKNSQ